MCFARTVLATTSFCVDFVQPPHLRCVEYSLMEFCLYFYFQNMSQDRLQKKEEIGVERDLLLAETRRLTHRAQEQVRPKRLTL